MTNKQIFLKCRYDSANGEVQGILLNIIKDNNNNTNAIIMIDNGNLLEVPISQISIVQPKLLILNSHTITLNNK